MRHVRRLSALLRRRLVDGRLPPEVRASLIELIRLRMLVPVADRISALRPVPRGGGGRRARLGTRRLVVTGPVDSSFHHAGIETAGQVSQWLGEAGIGHFLTGREGDRLVFGVELGRRRDLARALLDRSPDGEWYVEWERGSRSGIVALRGRRRSAELALSMATEWAVFEARSMGEIAVGPESAAVIRFWEIGTSGMCELVGERGQARFDPRSPAENQQIGDRTFPGRAAFPVDHSFETFDEPVDIVITWVDGSDPEWQREFSRWAHTEGRDVDRDHGLTTGRYRSRDELRYALRSIWYHCGWVRRVFVVTSGQRPSWLLEDERLRLVPHNEILPDDALPTFNSHAIESALHRIDGLAEHFIYLNDDMFIGRPVRPELFFTPNGLPRVFSSTSRVPGFEDDSYLAYDTASRRGRELLDETFGRVVSTKPMHAPYPQRRSTGAELEARYPEIMDRTAHSRFRHRDDLSVAASFALHYGLATERAVVGGLDAEYAHLESARLEWLLDRLLLGRQAQAFCLNETEQVGDQEHIDRLVGNFLEAYFPIPSGWEPPTEAVR